MSAIIFTGTYCVEAFIIQRHQIMTTIRVTPDPFGKGILDRLLLLLRQGRFFLIQYTAFRAVWIFHNIKDSYIAQVQRILQYLVGIRTACAVGHVGCDIGG